MVQLNAPMLLILWKEKLQVFRIYTRTCEFSHAASDDGELYVHVSWGKHLVEFNAYY